jgi:hypothetical protein
MLWISSVILFSIFLFAVGTGIVNSSGGEATTAHPALISSCPENDVQNIVVNLLSCISSLRNDSITRLGDLHAGNRSTLGMRTKYQPSGSWDPVYEATTTGGHQWCNLVRDNWSCSGDKYTEILKKTQHYDSKRLNPRLLTKGTKIFFEGNSLLAELFISIFCGTDPPFLYHIGGPTDSYLAYYPENDVILFALDNQYVWQSRPREIVEVLLKSNFHPIFIAVGGINVIAKEEDGETKIDRIALYRDTWPEAVIIPMLHSHLEWTCKAEGLHCGYGFGHQCFPGPVIREAEYLMKHILHEDHFVQLARADNYVENTISRQYLRYYLPGRTNASMP